jgi:phospholipid/cholesterol/gamma-HCH transport system substrate-binding protein
MRATTIRARARNHAFATVALGLAGIGAALAFAWVGFTSAQRIPWRSYHVVHARLRELGNLPPLGAEVRIAGRRVGEVVHPRLSGGVPTIDLQLDGDTEALHPDASLTVRPRGLLGVQYVDLNPGHSAGVLRDGATIPAARTKVSVDLAHVLSAFDARRRGELRTTVSALGEGMLGRGAQINDALRQAPSVLGGTRSLSSAVLARRGAAQRFAPSLESAAAAADPVRADIVRGWRPERRALRPFAQRAGALRAALTEAPPALGAIRSGLARSDPLLAQTADFADATTRLTRVAPKALAQATALLTRGRAPLRDADGLLHHAASAVPALLRFTSRVDPELRPLRDALAASLPLLRELGPRGCDMLGYWSNWRSMLSYAAGGNGPLGPLVVLRFELIASGETLAGPGSAAGPVGRNPYPAPCQAGAEGAP